MCRPYSFVVRKNGYDLLELPELPFPATATAKPLQRQNEEGRERGVDRSWTKSQGKSRLPSGIV